MLRHRILVALIGIPLGVAVIIYGRWAFMVFAALVSLVALHEFYTMIRPYRPNLLVGYVAAAGLIAGSYFAGFVGMVGAMAAAMVLMVAWAMGGTHGDHLTARISVTVFGVIWIALGLAYLVLLRELDHGMALVLLVVGCTWLNDTFAYTLGKLVGRHRLAPRISPKKTVEGAVGGLLGSVVFGVGVKIYSPWLPWREAIILGLVVGVAGQFGDLLESAVKRDLRVKDSGRLLPGHGGVLDRFDSLVLAAMAMYWSTLLLLRDVVGGFPL